MCSARFYSCRPASRLPAWLLIALLPLTGSATELERQRQLFNEVYTSAERGNWSAVEQLDDSKQSLLRRYVLWPDLRASWFRARIRSADHGEIEAFLDQFGDLRPARELRYGYALHLASAGVRGCGARQLPLPGRASGPQGERPHLPPAALAVVEGVPAEPGCSHAQIHPFRRKNTSSPRATAAITARAAG